MQHQSWGGWLFLSLLVFGVFFFVSLLFWVVLSPRSLWSVAVRAAQLDRVVALKQNNLGEWIRFSLWRMEHTTPMEERREHHHTKQEDQATPRGEGRRQHHPRSNQPKSNHHTTRLTPHTTSYLLSYILSSVLIIFQFTLTNYHFNWNYNYPFFQLWLFIKKIQITNIITNCVSRCNFLIVQIMVPWGWERRNSSCFQKVVKPPKTFLRPFPPLNTDDIFFW